MGKKVNRRKRQCRVDTNGFLGRTLVHPAYIQGILSQSRIERSLSLSWFYRNAPESALSEMFVFDHALRRHNGNDISRREASAASEAVGLQAHVGQAPITTCEQNEPAFLLQPQIGLLISMPRASSYTEKTSCFCARNHCATAGPVHSSTRKRIYVGSNNGTNVVFARDFVANNKHA